MSRDGVAEQGVPQPPFSRRHIAAAFLLIGMFWSVLGAWGAMAPIGGAVIAPGLVVVESHRKAIQHLEGGIVKRVLVKEGAKVRAGDVLIEMSDVTPASNLERVATQLFESMATVARLTAERDESGSMPSMDQALREAGQHRSLLNNALQAQTRIFQSRRQLIQQRGQIIDKQIERLQSDLAGQAGKLTSIEGQLRIVGELRKDATTLLDKQLIRRSRMAEIDKDYVQLEGKLSEARATTEHARQQIAQLELQRGELFAAHQAEVADQLRLQQARLVELRQEFGAVKDVQTRTRIRSPIDGTVVGLQVHSRDGVVARGQTLLEIVPTSDALIVEARLKPEDVTEVRVGTAAQVVLTTPSRRFAQPIAGTVEHISADRLTDAVNGRPYYQMKLKLHLDSAGPGVKVLAGMPAEVFVQIDERTALAYLTSPLVRTMQRGMRER